MERIIAARFQTVGEADAAAALMSYIDSADISIFHNNPPGQHGVLAAGGDEDEDPAQPVPASPLRPRPFPRGSSPARSARWAVRSSPWPLPRLAPIRVPWSARWPGWKNTMTRP